MYTVYNRQASWVTYKLERRRPAGYCIQAALAGQLEPHISWDKLERPEIEREKFLNVSLFRSWVRKINHTKNPFAPSLCIPINIENIVTFRNRIFRRRDFSEQILGSWIRYKIFTNLLFDFY